MKKNVSYSLLAALLLNACTPVAALAHTHSSPGHCKPKPQPKPKHSKCNEFFKKVDYIIIGAGTAGLPCAWALTNNKHKSVLVLEAGQDLSNDPAVLSPSVFAYSSQLTNNPKYAFTFVTDDSTSPSQVYSIGRMIGGSSGHNGLQAVRGTPDIYNEWATLSGNKAWSYKNLLPIFIQQEHYKPLDTIANPEQRGLDGRLYISQQAPLTDPFSQALAQGLGVPTYPEVYDYNDHTEIAPGVYENTVGVFANQQWATDYCVTQTCGVRSFSGNSYLHGIPEVGLPPIVDENLNGLHGRKLYVRTGTTVTKILFKGTRAVGVELIVNENGVSKTYITKARKGVILAASSVLTPAILQRSGIGKASDLEPLGIEVLVENDNVGYNLENHYGPATLVRNICTFNPDPCATPPLFELNEAFWDTNGGIVRNVETIFLTGGLLPFTISATLGLTVDQFQLIFQDIGMLHALLRPHSRGSVVIQSTDPLTLPFINLNEYTDTDGMGGSSQDLADAVVAFKKMQDVAVAQGGGPEDVLYPPNAHYPAPWGPAPDDSLLEQDALNNSLSTYHIAGTCRMSLTPDTGVVNGKLRVHGLDNVYICDTSIEPKIQTGNTAYAAFFIGLKLAEFLGGKIK